MTDDEIDPVAELAVAEVSLDRAVEELDGTQARAAQGLADVIHALRVSAKKLRDDEQEVAEA